MSVLHCSTMAIKTLRLHSVKSKIKAFLLSHFPVFILFLAAVIALQWAGRAYHADFGGDWDEGGHYVTGLMVRDFIANGHLTSPMSFAENYYLHYPKVALGHWPPFFYLLQSAWTLLFSPARTSIILLMALLTALLATVLYSVLRTEFGVMAGVAGGLLLVSSPLVQSYYGMVMAEMPAALLIFLATIAFGKYLETERWQYAIVFGLLASLAILTKGSAFCLALLPLMAIIVSRRFYLIKRPSFWYPAIAVALLCGPWYFFTRHMAVEGFLYRWGPEYTSLAVPYFFRELLKAVGFGLSVLAAVGFFVTIIKPPSGVRISGKWAAAGGLLFSVIILQSLVPAGLDDRFVIPAVPALVMFIVAGVASLSRSLPSQHLTDRHKALIVVALATIVYLGETFAIARKPDHGFTAVATDLLARPEFKNSVFLISSDSKGEGAFISEVARFEERPGHIVLRALKVLSRNRWGGPEEKLAFQTSAEVMKFLDEIPVGIIVLDLSPDAMELKHHQQLLQTVNENPQSWELLAAYPVISQPDSSPGEIRVYSLIGHQNRPPGRIKLDMNYMLKRSIEK